jgi:hypothetical protein
LKEFLRKGDTFHLISFSETPRIELSRRIEGEGDYRTIIGRLLLLYPLTEGSSLENAAAYAERFVAELPPARQKKVVFFTPQSDAQSGVAPTELSVRFNSENTNVYLASTPASFGTLAGGRVMREAPPEPTATMAVTAILPVASSLAIELVELAKPILPVIEALPVSPPAQPIIKMAPESPPEIMAVLTSPESRLIGSSDEPILFDKIKAMTTILSLAGMILLFALVLSCAVTWKKRGLADAYTIEDFLSQMDGDGPENAENRTRYAIPAQGLLRKADEMKGQLA